MPNRRCSYIKLGLSAVLLAAVMTYRMQHRFMLPSRHGPSLFATSKWRLAAALSTSGSVVTVRRFFWFTGLVIPATCGFRSPRSW